jgi:DNA helicase HerA-like ATPase
MASPLNISVDLTLDLEDLIGQCVAILGIRGSGKSNTAGVLFEELLKYNYPLSVVDIDGEYFGLKERFEVLVVGQGEGVEIEVDVDCAKEIAEISMEKNVPIVLDLSGFLSEDRNDFLKEYLSALWSLAGKLRRPYIVGIEEAHEFIPQGVKTELKELIARVALRGRKRGLGAVIISQRSAKVDKDVLSQAGMLFLHRVVHEGQI